MKTIHYVGMDVHKETIQIAVFSEHGNDPTLEKEILHDHGHLRGFFKGLSTTGRVVSCYEAGCVGYSLHRFLEALEIKNTVIAPASIPKSPKERAQKNDRQDARMLGRMLRDGRLTPIAVPSPQNEAVRDFLRYREDIKNEITHARQRLTGFLLRHHLLYEKGRSHWTQHHRQWLLSLKLVEPVAQMTLRAHLTHLDSLLLTYKEIEGEVKAFAAKSEYASAIEKLCGLKGVSTLTALSFIVEIGDFNRFPTAGALMNYLGLVPREHSSGNHRQQGRITKCGNGHLRTLLIEGSWSFRFRSRASEALAKRRKTLAPEILGYCDKAGRHLEDKYRYLVIDQKKPAQLAVTAVARELSGFIWGLMTERVA